MEGMYIVHIVLCNMHINISTDTKIYHDALPLTDNFSH